MNWVPFVLWLVVLLVYGVAVMLRRKTFIRMVEQIFSPMIFAVFLLSSAISLVAIFWVMFKDLHTTAYVAMVVYVCFALVWPVSLLLHWWLVPTGTTKESDVEQDDEFVVDTMKRHLRLGVLPQAFVLFSSFVAASVVTISIWDDSMVRLRVPLIVWVLQAAYDATLWNAQYYFWIRGRVTKDGETMRSFLRAAWVGDVDLSVDENENI